MAKRKAEYIEGRKARENFEDAMRHAFSIPKEKAPPKQRCEINAETAAELIEDSRKLLRDSQELKARLSKRSRKSGKDGS